MQPLFVRFASADLGCKNLASRGWTLRSRCNIQSLTITIQLILRAFGSVADYRG